MRRLLSFAALLFAVVALFVSAAFADQVLLKNGDRITGKVLRLDASNLLIKTEAMGDVKVKWGAVEKILAEEGLHLVADGAQVRAGSIERTKDADTIVTTGKASFTVSSGRILALRSDGEQTALEQQAYREQHPQFLDRWEGTLDAGLSAARGNADTTNMSLGLKGARTTDTTRLSLYFTSLLARNRLADGTTVNSANAVRSGLRYEVNVSDRIFTFGFGNFEYNKVQQLDFRDVIGGGAGVRLAKTEHGTLDIFTGASMNQESYSSGMAQDRRNGEILFGQDLAFTLSSRTAFSSRVSLFPNLSDRGEYRAVMDTTATTKLNSWLGWQVTISNVYLSNPPLGSRPNDLLLSTGLRFSLGQERAFKPRAAFGRQMGY